MKNVKTSLKPIPLSMRGKKRYISFELVSDKRLLEKEVFRAVNQSLLQLYGEVGVARQRPWLVSFKDNQGVLRCASSEVEAVKAGLLFLEKIASNPVSPKILRVSGSVKGAK
jgi:ribonuclease P/MRP protein subunit POP5